MSALVPRALKLDRKQVRDHARERFHYQRVVDEYVKIYEGLVGGNT